MKRAEPSRSSIVIKDWKDLNLQLSEHLTSRKYKLASRSFRCGGASRNQFRASCDLGRYIIKNRPAKHNVILQAPHTKADLHTGIIASKLCKRFDYQACGFNTGHRRDLDYSHDLNSPFQVFTRLLKQRFPKATTVQIHGFNRNKKAKKYRKTDLILSGGSKREAKIIERALKRLGLDRDPSIRIYGRDSRILGATTNIQNKMLRKRGFPAFLHVEMSLPMRKKALRDPKILNLLNSIITAVDDEYKKY